MSSDGHQNWDTSKRAIGSRIADVRRARGLTQIALAEALGESSQRINNYERGKATVPPDLLARIVRLTGATADFVLFGKVEGLPFDLAVQIDAASREGKRA